MSIFFILILLLVCLFFYMTYIEPCNVVVEKVEIHDSFLASVFRGMKVVHLSDLHVKERLGFRERRLLSLLRELKPDLVLITGDFIDTSRAISAMKELSMLLPAGIGVFAVPGNNDHHAISVSELESCLVRTPVRFLINRGQRIALPNGQKVNLVGVDDPTTGHADLATALSVMTGEPTVMLCHSSAIFQAAQDAGVKLLLVGHSHGGQVRIPGVVQLFHFLKGGGPIMGLYKAGATHMYVNRGVGTRTVPFRIFCKPEITLFTFIDEV